MPDTPSITLIKRMMYRGQQEEWSNTYHFTGTQPANAAAWKTLADALIGAEKQLLPASQSYVRAYGYNAGNEHSVAQIDYVALGGALVTGTLTTAGLTQLPGDAAVQMRALIGTSTRGKKVYIRKYFHGAVVDPSTPDNVQANQKSAINSYLGVLLGGTLPGSFKWSGPQGQEATAVTTPPYITTRTLKRRGKRP